MSSKLRFEDVSKPSKMLLEDAPVAAAPVKPKRKYKPKLPDDVKATDTPMNKDSGKSYIDGVQGNNVGSNNNYIYGNIDSAGLRGTSRTLQSIVPEENGEEADDNAAVSATRLAADGIAAVAGTAASSLKPRKSGLKNKMSRLEFEEKEPGTENNAQSETDNRPPDSENQAPSPNEENPSHDSGLSDNENSVPLPNNTNTTEQSISQALSKATSDTRPSAEKDLSTDKDSTTATDKETDENTSADTDNSPDTGKTADTDTSADSDTDGKLRAKEQKQIGKLEEKAELYEKRLGKVREKLPTKTVQKTERFYDEEKGKTGIKLNFEKEIIPIGEAKWNNPKAKVLPAKAVSTGMSMAVTKVHAKIHSIEHENVSVEAAHKAELMGESAYRGTKRSVHSAYRFHKNRPYRQAARLEQKSIKTRVKLDYKKALRDNPKLKDSPVSRFFRKRSIKRRYADAFRKSKKGAKAAKTSVRLGTKIFNIATAIIRRNPIFLIKLGLLLLIVFVIVSLFAMCASLFSGGASAIGISSYAADYEDIDAASVAYTEWETDLRVYINSIEANYPDFDEYRYFIGDIGHNPLELMAFLTAVFHDFAFAEVEPTLRQVFEAQYTLELVPEIEIRQRWEQTGLNPIIVGTDPYTGEYIIEWIPVYGWVDYEWHILNVTLTSRPLSEVLQEFMNEEQTFHYLVLMQSLGMRQFVGNPFDFNWLPYVTSLFGYRIHPISGERRFHWGLDIGLPTGTPIRAGFDGIVIAVGYDANGYGNFVVIENDEGFQARYAHCHEVYVVEGQEVELGDIIATVGSTGASTGPHLHIEVVRDGRRINPIFFVNVT